MRCYPSVTHSKRDAKHEKVTRNVTRNTSLLSLSLSGAVLLGYHLFVPAGSS